jgi:hypothetical protein
MQLSQQPGNKFQAVMDTFLWKRLILYLRIPLSAETKVKKETLCILCASGVVLTSTPHMQSLNRPNIAGLSGGGFSARDAKIGPMKIVPN